MAKQRIGRCELHREGEAGTLARVDRRVDRVTGQGEDIAQTVGVTIVEEIVARPVGHRIILVGEGVRHLEIVVGPLQLAGQGDGGAGDAGGAETSGVSFRAIRLALVEDTDCEGVGLLAPEPRLREGDVIVLIELACCGDIQGKALAVATRDGRPGIFLEQFLGGEIVEGYTRRDDESHRAVARAQRELVGTGLLHHVVDIDGAVGLVGLGLHVHLLLVEIAERHQHLLCADDVGTVE